MRRRLAFSLVELLIVISLIAVLAAISIPKSAKSVERSKTSSSSYHIHILQDAVDRFYADTGLYPKSNWDLKNGPASSDAARTNAPATGLDSAGNERPLDPTRFRGPYIFKWGKDPIKRAYYIYSVDPPNVGRVYAP